MLNRILTSAMTQPTNIQSPVFETERLYIRGVTATDIPAYTADFVDYDVIQSLSAAVPWPYPNNGVAEYVLSHLLPTQGNNHWAWSICLNTNPTRQIGNITLWRPGTPENRGFWLAKKHWGKGYMTEAVAPVMDWAFDELGFDHLLFTNATGNPRSRRVKEKTGAKLIRTEPGDYVDPNLKEQEIWKLTAAEWKAHKDT